MKTIRAFGVLFISLIMQTIFLPIRLVIFCIEVAESILRIVKKILTYLMKEIKSEVLK